MLTYDQSRIAADLVRVLNKPAKQRVRQDVVLLSHYMGNPTMHDAVVAHPLLTADPLNVAAWAAVVDNADAAANLRCTAATLCPTTAYAAALLKAEDAARGHELTKVLLLSTSVMSDSYWEDTVKYVRRECAAKLLGASA